MTAGLTARRALGTLRHDAMFYDSDAAYLDGVLPFLRDGIDAGEATFVAVPDTKLALIRDGLGGAAAGVEFADMTDLGRNPGRIIPTVRSFLDDQAGRTARFVGEPAWAGRTPVELAEATRHEALLNVAFGCAPVAILCPYDSRGLDAAVLADAHRTHPTILTGRTQGASDAFTDPLEFTRSSAWPLRPPPSGAENLDLADVTLPAVRRIVRRATQAAGLADARTDDLLLGLNELVTNTFVHASGHGRLRLWREPGAFVYQVEDAGHITDPLAGRHLPAAGAEGGRGLWLVNRLSDLVELRSTESGTTVRVHMALPGLPTSA